MSDEVQRSLGRLEGKLDAALEKMDNHEPRIARLERWQAWTFGAAGAVGVVVGVFWKILPLVARGH